MPARAEDRQADKQSGSLLQIRDLRTHFFTPEGVVRAVDGVSFAVERGEILGLVGESGSGKSVACLSILGLLPDPPGRIVGGEILFRSGEGAAEEDLTQASERRLRAVRGARIAMIFQDPMTSLNPYLKIGVQLREVLEIHEGLRGKAARRRTISMLAAVGLPAPEARLDDYPHQLSGGMRQRVMIAMALLCQPDVLIADEPTTALDVTIQAQILELIRERRDELGLAVVLVTHDLGVVAKMADRVAVMYAGRIVEQGRTEAIFATPQHPYTWALQRSIPRLDGATERGELYALDGLPPSTIHRPPGCTFHPRCEHALDVCRERWPAERTLCLAGAEHRVCCHLAAPPREGSHE